MLHSPCYPVIPPPAISLAGISRAAAPAITRAFSTLSKASFTCDHSCGYVLDQLDPGHGATRRRFGTSLYEIRGRGVGLDTARKPQRVHWTARCWLLPVAGDSVQAKFSAHLKNTEASGQAAPANTPRPEERSR